MGGTGELARNSVIYLKITFLDMPFMFLFFNFNSIMNAEGNTVLPTILSAISAVLNMVLDPLFIFTFNMGIAGAAIATLLAKAVLAIAGIYVLMRKSSKVRPSFKKFRFDGDIIKNVVSVATIIYWSIWFCFRIYGFKWLYSIIWDSYPSSLCYGK